MIRQPIEQLAIKHGGAVFSPPPTPPEPIPVHFMVRPPEHGDVRIAKLFQESCDDIHLVAPVLV